MRILSQNLLMLLHFPGRIFRPTRLLIKPAHLVMRRGMLRLELQHRFKGADGILNMAPTFLSQAKLKIQRGDCRIDLLGLLKSLDSLLWLV